MKIKRRKKKEPRNMIVMNMILHAKGSEIKHRNSKRLQNPKKIFLDFED